MSHHTVPRERYGEAFWRAHHEAWKRSDLNSRQYCEVQGLSLKAFGDWRVKFMAEPETPVRKQLDRRGGIGHTPSRRLSHTFGHTPCHVTYPSLQMGEAPVVPPLRGGHRRRFAGAQRAYILAEAAKPGASDSRGDASLRYP